VIPIHVPPLRERRSDIKLLINHFIDKITKREGVLREKSISDRAVNLLKKYDWPGNIRELENLTERLIITSRNDEIGIEDIPEDILEKISSEEKELSEKVKVIKALKESRGNKTRAAEILEISRKTLYNWIKKYKDDEELAKLIE